MKADQRDADSPVGAFDASAGSGDLAYGGSYDMASEGGRFAWDAVNPSALDGGGNSDAKVVAIPVEIPSRQKVTFRVTNGASAVRYLGVAADALWGGKSCSPYAISRGTANLALAIPYQCGCECPAPSEPGLTELWVLSPGQTKDLVWDARALATYSTSMTCSAIYAGGSQPPPATILHGVWQPVDPGNYQVTLIVKSAVPTTCKVNNEVVSCDRWSEDTYGRWQGGLCDRTTTVNASFDLPEAGDVIVPVTL